MRDLLVRFRGNRSQAKMAEKYGVTQQTWSNWERGEGLPRPHIMAKIEKDSGFEMKKIFFDAFNKRKLLRAGKKGGAA